MSNTKRIASKAKFRKSIRRRQRAMARITVDIETRAGHFHIGDNHIGDSRPLGNHDQLLAYATLAGVTEFMVINGGDILDEFCGERTETIR